MLHWCTVVSMLAIAVLFANYILLWQKLHSCLQEALLERDKRNISAASLVKEQGTSVWCWGNDHTSRLCRFTNLCYLSQHDTFAFFHNVNRTIVSGVPVDRFDPALLDLSTVVNHSGQYFNYADVPAMATERLLGAHTKLVSGTSVIFNRFHPDNLMHVLHDDLLPLYDSLKMITRRDDTYKIAYDVQLVMADGRVPGEFHHLYDMFSTLDPIYLRLRQGHGANICFADAYVGLSKDTRWYDYGFNQPQGPIEDHGVNADHIKPAAEFLKARMGVVTAASDDKEAVILSRRHNRLIINEAELSVEMAAMLGLRVRTLSLEDTPLEEIIRRLSRAAVVVGMHGSLLALAVFLPPGSVLVELFPYAVNPNHYTPYRTLARLPGMAVTYRAWRNMDPTRNIAHPSAPPETGGIVHLRWDEQDRIQRSPEVPLHLCCDDPEWLFRIYQDTIVDIPALLDLIRNALDQRQVLPTRSHPRFFPTEVRQLVCIENDGPGLSVSWMRPWNVDYIPAADFKYEVWIQEDGCDDYRAWILFQTSHEFVEGLKPNAWYLVWVRCLSSDDIAGPFNRVPLHCSTRQLDKKI